MRTCTPLTLACSALLLGMHCHAVAEADARSNAHDLAMLDTIACDWNRSSLHVERVSSTGRRTLTEFRCIKVLPAHSHGISKTRIPPCVAEEPSTLKVVITTGSLAAIEAAIPGLKLARIGKAGEGGAGRLLEFVETGVRHTSVHLAGDFIAHHLPQQTVARCTAVRIGVPWRDAGVHFKSATAYLRDLHGETWQECPTRAGGICPSGDAAWMNVPTANSPVFTTLAEMVAEMPEEWSNDEKWRLAYGLAYSAFRRIHDPLVLNWSEHKARIAILVFKYEADGAVAPGAAR